MQPRIDFLLLVVVPFVFWPVNISKNSTWPSPNYSLHVVPIDGPADPFADT